MPTPDTQELIEALEPFVRHGRALGAFSVDPGPFSVMTDKGHRDIPKEDFCRARKALSRARSADEQGGASFQDRVKPWMDACFGPEISADRVERNDRFMEEALELVQASGYPKERAYALIEYVYGRDQGEINQEVGGVMVTLAAHCLAHGVDMHEAGETELARIWTKVEQIRAKQATKPTGSALPIAQPTPPADLVEVARRITALVLGYSDWTDATDYRLTGTQDRERDRVLAIILQALSPHLSEREKIVAWLRTDPAIPYEVGPAITYGAYKRDIADAISRGDHISGEGR